MNKSPGSLCHFHVVPGAIIGDGYRKSWDPSRSPFLPGYAASLLSRPTIKSAPCAVSSVLSSRPSSSVAASTCGLADIDVPKYVCEPDCFPPCPFLSRPRIDFADLSSPCFSPGSGSVPAVSSTSSGAVPAVQPSCPIASVAVSPVRPSSVASVAGSPVSSSPVTVPQFRAVSSVAASSPVMPSSASTVPPRVLPNRPVRPAAAPYRSLPSLRSPVPTPVVRPLLPSCRPVFPMACFALVVLPVLLPTPFGFVLSFLPVLR